MPGNIYIKKRVSVDQGFALPESVGGSKEVNRDLSSEFNWWGLKPKKQREAVPRLVDENGAAYHLCSGGHYRPVRAFDKDNSRKTGLRAFCKQCRHEQYLRMTAEAAEKASKPLHRYRERKEAHQTI